MILLFTDFGSSGPYVGQMKAVLQRAAPGVAVIDLCHDAPAFDAMASAYLLAALASDFPTGSLFLCVVDPGVGGTRLPLAIEAGGHWFVGPDNGLLAIAARRADRMTPWRITWRPERLSASFHGRDLFAPVATRLIRGEAPEGEVLDPRDLIGRDWPDDLGRIIYFDSFGNAMTGLRAHSLPADARLSVSGQVIRPARTFCDVAPGEAFWYQNANGLAEIAVNQGRAEQALDLSLGLEIEILTAS